MSANVSAEIVFTLLVFAAILTLFTEYAAYVVGALILAVIWQFVQVFGPSLFLATLLVSIFLMLRVVAMAASRDVGSPVLARLLDELLHRQDQPMHEPPERRFIRRPGEHPDTAADRIDDEDR